MTFDELRAILRDDYLAESSTDFYTDADLNDMLFRSARDIASALRFPVTTITQAVTAGVTGVTLTGANTALDVEPDSVTFSGFRLALAPTSDIRMHQEIPNRPPRYYNFDPARDQQFLLAPKPNVGGNLVFDRVDEYGSGLSGGVAAWGGLYSAFHELIALRAAVTAFQRSFEADRSSYYADAYNGRVREFAQFIGRGNYATAILREGANASQ